jgi:hypothetical protein
LSGGCLVDELTFVIVPLVIPLRHPLSYTMFGNFNAPNLSNRQALGLTAFASVIATTSVILSYQALRREHRTERLKRQVGEDVEHWEQSRAGSGFGTPEERAERRAEGDRVDGEWKVREWKKGEFDEGLIREQVR